MTKPPFTEAERTCLEQDIERWKSTGYGVDPNQIAFRHYENDETCECHQCAGTPILYTVAPVFHHAHRPLWSPAGSYTPPARRGWWER